MPCALNGMLRLRKLLISSSVVLLRATGHPAKVHFPGSMVSRNMVATLGFNSRSDIVKITSQQYVMSIVLNGYISNVACTIA